MPQYYPSIKSRAEAERYLSERSPDTTERPITGFADMSIRLCGLTCDIVIQQRTTDIVRYHQDDTITLNTGGWKTATTKDRLNAFTPAQIIQIDGLWYVRTVGRLLFKDGMQVDRFGHPVASGGRRP